MASYFTKNPSFNMFLCLHFFHLCGDLSFPINTAVWVLEKSPGTCFTLTSLVWIISWSDLYSSTTPLRWDYGMWSLNPFSFQRHLTYPFSIWFFISYLIFNYGVSFILSRKDDFHLTFCWKKILWFSEKALKHTLGYVQPNHIQIRSNYSFLILLIIKNARDTFLVIISCPVTVL